MHTAIMLPLEHLEKVSSLDYYPLYITLYMVHSKGDKVLALSNQYSANSNFWLELVPQWSLDPIKMSNEFPVFITIRSTQTSYGQWSILPSRSAFHLI